MDELWSQIQPWDACCLLVLMVSALLGLWRGLVLEVLALAGLALAFLLAQWGAHVVQQMLPADVGLLAHAQVRWVVAFLLVFVAVSASSTLVARLLRKWLRHAGLGGLDRLLGMVFGVVRALVLLWVMTAVVVTTPLRDSDSWQQSVGASLLQASLQELTPLLPPTFIHWLQAGAVRDIARQRGAAVLAPVLPQIAASAVNAAASAVPVPLNR